MSITLGNVEVVAKHDVGLAKANLNNWPDGLVGKRWFRPTTQPVFWAGNGGNLAYVNIDSNTSLKYPKPNNLPPDITYCSGGPILTSFVDGSWVMVNHVERKPNEKVFWSTIDLTRSIDNGKSWNYLGCIIEPYKGFSTTNSQSCEVAGGAVCYVGEKLHFYFREPQGDYRGRASVAFVNALQFFTDISNDKLPSLVKYRADGTNPSALGRNLADQLSGLPLECNWQDVIYVADKKLYLMTFCPFNDTQGYKAKGIYGAISNDGIIWNSLGKTSLVSETNFAYYPNLVSLNYDERFAMSNALYLYWLHVLDTSTVWPGMEWHRQQVIVS